MVVFVNKLTLTGTAEELEQRYARVGEFMETQPGLIRYQLVRSQKDPSVYFNIAEWDTAESFQTAMKALEFRARLKPVTDITTGDPHLADVAVWGDAVRAS